MLTFPKDTAQFSWTRHIKNKMVFYHLSSAQILRIFRKPDRREEGIAPNTVACMQAKIVNRRQRKVADSNQESNLPPTTYNPKPAREEIWIMYRLNTKQSRSSLQPTTHNLKPSRITMISAWRYPGITKPGERPPIPEDLVEMLEEGIY